MANEKFNSADILKTLAGAGFPADKKALIETAKKNNAPGELVAFLNSDLPERTYRAPTDVLKALKISED
jgi:hypothetical protein